MIDCDELPGRLRDICRGHDDAGNPVLTREKRDAYRYLFENGVGRPRLTPAEREELHLEFCRESWRLIHAYPVEHWNDWDAIDAAAWYSWWDANRVPGGCECRTEWRKIKKQRPPDFTSAQAFFAWSNWAHNQVDERLGKPTLSLSDAMAVYSLPLD